MTEECGYGWKAKGWHECARTPGHTGGHLCGYHDESCCSDCVEQWTEPCGAEVAA